MFWKKNKYFLFCGLLIVSTLNAEEASRGGSPFGELKNSSIVSGYQVSTGGNFFGASFQVTSSVAQTLVGTASTDLGEFVLHSGRINPNRDLIFINGLDLIFLNEIMVGNSHD